MNRHLVLLKNEIEFQRIEGDKFENRGIQHLRYNYKLLPNITLEVFGQGQYNKVSKIDFRGLVGTGPRFKLTQLEDYKFYLGTLLMYEELNCFEEALKHFGTRVEVICAMELGGRISAEDAYQMVKEELKAVKKCRKQFNKEQC